MLFRVEDIPILYEDPDLLVVQKPAGISVIPERYEEGEPSLLDLFSLRYTGSEDMLNSEGGDGPKPVHRIDKDTSGIVLFSKTEEAFRALSLQFQERRLSKIYHALVMGRPLWSEITCDVALLPDGDRRHRTIVHPDGKPSQTWFRVLETFRGYALIEAQPKTGRTHQIRVHLSYLGYPIVGDELYGGGGGLYLSSFKKDYKGSQPYLKEGTVKHASQGRSFTGPSRAENARAAALKGGRGYAGKGAGSERPLIGRLALHALSLQFLHPCTGEPLRFEAPYPKDFSVALKQLRKYGK
ncbi:MAG: pseudouridine synthase [Spirochaetes bacterium]|nr:pseudouridine synthase [Spirochaetota bacterium]